MPKLRSYNWEDDLSIKNLEEEIQNIKEEREKTEGLRFMYLTRDLIKSLQEYYVFSPSNDLLLEIAALQDEINDYEGRIESLTKLYSLNEKSHYFMTLLAKEYISLAWEEFFNDNTEDAKEYLAKALKTEKIFKDNNPGTVVDDFVLTQSQLLLSKI